MCPGRSGCNGSGPPSPCLRVGTRRCRMLFGIPDGSHQSPDWSGRVDLAGEPTVAKINGRRIRAGRPLRPREESPQPVEVFTDSSTCGDRHHRYGGHRPANRRSGANTHRDHRPDLHFHRQTRPRARRWTQRAAAGKRTPPGRKKKVTIHNGFRWRRRYPQHDSQADSLCHKGNRPVRFVEAPSRDRHSSYRSAPPVVAAEARSADAQARSPILASRRPVPQIR